MKPFRLLTLAAMTAALVPRLVHEGMFVDGVTYAAIARNLAEGRGSFWSPHYTVTLYPVFHEHPPLGFWIQSLLFRIFGDHLFVERAYTLAAALVSAWLIGLLWRRIDGPARQPPPRRPRSAEALHATAEGGHDRGRADLDWLPIALWIAAPVVSWSIVGNLLETTVTVFTLAAVLCALRAEHAETNVEAVAWAVLSGVCVAGATLTKGPVGLFPLMAPLVFPAMFGNRRIWTTLAGQGTAVAVCALMLASIPEARASLGVYVNEQVIAAITGRREVADGSLTIVKELLQGVLVPMGIVAAISIATARRFVRLAAGQRELAAACLVLGLCGSIPILASTKQTGHYLVPAVPFFALGAAVILGPTVWTMSAAVARRQTTALTLASTAILIGTLAASLSPAIGRDRARMADLDALEAVVPRGVTIGICPESNGDWGLHAWFERRFHVSLDATGGHSRDWFLKTASTAEASCQPTTGCKPATELSHELILMTCSRQ